jgi:hypothetical protein
MDRCDALRVLKTVDASLLGDLETAGGSFLGCSVPDLAVEGEGGQEGVARTPWELSAVKGILSATEVMEVDQSRSSETLKSLAPAVPMLRSFPKV